MAMISVRDLQRNAKDIFDKIEDDSEPVVITRRGRPIAALTPVNQAQAEAILVATSSEFIESRQQAENARAEGRTASLQQMLTDAAEHITRSPRHGRFLHQDAYLVFDDSLKALEEWVHINADTEVDKISRDVTQRAIEAVMGQSPRSLPTDEHWQKTIRSMNGQLVRLNLYKELLEFVHLGRRSSSRDSQRETNMWSFEPRQIECAVMNTKTQVERINGNFIMYYMRHDPAEFSKLFEAGLHGAVVTTAGELEEVQKGRDAASLVRETD